jgi:hypothetical protein
LPSRRQPARSAITDPPPPCRFNPSTTTTARAILSHGITGIGLCRIGISNRTRAGTAATSTAADSGVPAPVRQPRRDRRRPQQSGSDAISRRSVAPPTPKSPYVIMSGYSRVNLALVPDGSIMMAATDADRRLQTGLPRRSLMTRHKGWVQAGNSIAVRICVGFRNFARIRYRNGRSPRACANNCRCSRPRARTSNIALSGCRMASSNAAA